MTLDFTIDPAEAPSEALEAVAQALADALHAQRQAGSPMTVTAISVTLAPPAANEGDDELLARAAATGYRSLVEPFQSPGQARRFFTPDLLKMVTGSVMEAPELARIAEAVIRTRTHCDF